jgi:hypothetical protein
MPVSDRITERAVRRRAFLIWESEGRPVGREQDHRDRATIDWFGEERRQDNEPMEDEEKILEGRLDANMPQLLTKDVRGG